MQEKLYGVYLPNFIKNNEKEYRKFGIIYTADKYDYCPCGSGKKYRFCHSEEVRKEEIRRKKLGKNYANYKSYLASANQEVRTQSSGEFGPEFKKLVEKPNSSESLWNCLATLEDNDLDSNCKNKMGSHTIYRKKGLEVLGELLEIDKFQLRSKHSYISERGWDVCPSLLAI